MENSTLAMHTLYYAMCLLNFVAALWMATSITRMRGTDLWLFRAAIMVAGLVHVIITVAMFKYPEYAREGASTLLWWWALSVFGLLVALQPLKVIPPVVVRVATYAGAALAFWGAYLVFFEQPYFNELATYYGFFGINLAAAVWVMGMALSDEDMMQRKRVILMGTGVIYAGLVITAVKTMQMVLESPY